MVAADILDTLAVRLDENDGLYAASLPPRMSGLVLPLRGGQF